MIWDKVTSKVPASCMRLANVRCRLPGGRNSIPRPLNGDGGERNQCSKFVVVIGSEWFKSSTNGSTPGRCARLNNIVESTIFKTSQDGLLFYESAALTS
jgi:hypothetical protein